MMSPKSTVILLALFLSGFCALSQDCTTLGQTPSTAFPVCGTSVFHQANVPICATNDIFVPGCSDNSSANYQNKNPFFYKFTCFTAGTLGFLITPADLDEDYDWQLYDITGHNPQDIFTDHSLVVTGNWSGNYGTTGASSAGVSFIQCASSTAPPVVNTFAQMPSLTAGHEYLLMVSHYSDTQSGYDLSFAGGTAVITDPTLPHLGVAKTSCDGTTITLKLNKRMKCSSLSVSGSDFTISPAAPAIISAVAANCSAGFDFDEVVLTLAAPLPDNNYQLIIKNGSDNNTIQDNCDRDIPPSEQTPFSYFVPAPIFADSLGKTGCAPDEIKIYFPKKIKCNTIAPNGSDFTITGSTPVTVIGASGNCVNDQSDVIIVKLSAPIFTRGNYTLSLKTGIDGTTVIDECGIELPIQSLPFSTVDTVSAEYNLSMVMGCQVNTLTFSHDGAHEVNSWNWTFNNIITANTQTHTIQFPASGTNTVQLIVSNGICRDTVNKTIVLDNEVKALFDIPDIICPEDKLTAINNSRGLIDIYQWSFDIAGSSNVKDPLPVQFPPTNQEAYYLIKLVCTNTALGCTDTQQKKLRVLNNCFIAVPTGFTPNGDGLNDYLSPNNAIKAEKLEFSVYNRWGQLVFHSRNWQEKWDGKINGLPQASGVYVWFLSYTHRDTGQRVFQKGTTTLIR